MIFKPSDLWIHRYYRLRNFIGAKILDVGVRDKRFTIFSNDCWGGEVYRWMNLQYNTPFVGLMLMMPCYLNLLRRPRYYLSGPLQFITVSKYAEMNNFRKEHGYYPLAKIDDIEVHFLHYQTGPQAEEKWKKRIGRINWDNIIVKFAMDKDFATEHLLAEFEKLPYKTKISLSEKEYASFKHNVRVKQYDADATKLFSGSLKEINLVNLLNNKDYKLSGLKDKIISSLLFFLLKRP